MNDLIKRQDAIRVVREYMIDTQITDGDYHADGIERELYVLPSAEPTCNQLATNLQPTCNQLATNLQNRGGKDGCCQVF